MSFEALTQKTKPRRQPKADETDALIFEILAQGPRLFSELSPSFENWRYLAQSLRRLYEAGKVSRVAERRAGFRYYIGDTIPLEIPIAAPEPKPERKATVYAVPVKTVTIPVLTGLGLIAPVAVTLPAAPWEVSL